MRLLLISSALLGLSFAFPRADFGSNNHRGKVCTLEKSATKSKEDCFYEPECEDKCQDVTKNVRIKKVKIIKLNGLNFRSVVLLKRMSARFSMSQAARLWRKKNVTWFMRTNWSMIALPEPERFVRIIQELSASPLRRGSAKQSMNQSQRMNAKQF